MTAGKDIAVFVRGFSLSRLIFLYNSLCIVYTAFG